MESYPSRALLSTVCLLEGVAGGSIWPFPSFVGTTLSLAAGLSRPPLAWAAPVRLELAVPVTSEAFLLTAVLCLGGGGPMTFCLTELESALGCGAAPPVLDPSPAPAPAALDGRVVVVVRALGAALLEVDELDELFHPPRRELGAVVVLGRVAVGARVLVVVD